MFEDTPKIWQDGNEESTAIVEKEEEKKEIKPLPSKEECLSIVENSEIDEDNKSMLTALDEMQRVALTLQQITNEETFEMQKSVIKAWSVKFLEARYKNNTIAEDLKRKILKRVIDNVDCLDLETAMTIYKDLTDVSTVDHSSAFSMISGGTGLTGGNSGPTFNLNIANGDNANATSNTMNVGTGPGINQLKEVAAMNNNLNAWNNVDMPRKEKNVTDADITADL